MTRNTHFFLGLLIVVSVSCTRAAAQDTARAIDKTDSLVVRIGCDNPDALQQLMADRKAGAAIVQGLTANGRAAAELQTTAAQRYPDGSVTIQSFDGTHLPYVDNLVNTVIASADGGVSRQEIMRVLAPGGAAWIDGKRIDKPRPETIDQWTHYLHGPDNNAVANDTEIGPPRHARWVGGPLWTRNHHNVNSVSTVVTDGACLYYIVDRAPSANLSLPGKWYLVSIDAFNGIKKWERPVSEWVARDIRFRVGPPQVTRLLVVHGGSLYMPLETNAPVSRLQAASGKVVTTYADTKAAEEIIITGDTMLVLTGAPVAEQATKLAKFRMSYRFPNRKTITAVDLTTGKTLWRWSPKSGDLRPETLAADGQQVYVQQSGGVTCLDQNSGKVVWQFGEVHARANRKLSYGVYTLVVHDDVVLCNLNGSSVALSTDDGRELWRSATARHGFHAPLDIFVINDVVWLGTQRPDSVAPPAVGDFSVGLDLHTGKPVVRKPVLAELQTAGHHHRCYREKATTRYILAGKRGIELLDLEGSNNVRNNWTRGTCQYGILPANGLIYCPPTSCGCYMESLLHGFWSLAASDSAMADPARQLSPAQRLTKGPAFEKVASAGDVDDDAWTTYRGNALRSGTTSAELPDQLQPVWTKQIGGRLTQPVIADGVAVVASIDAHVIHGLDARTGTSRWHYVCTGRVDSPPTLHEGLALFGSDDGHVYCLRLRDGQLVWKFQCAPSNLQNIGYGQLASVWPVHGSILVLNGVAYCAAGRSTWIDGGIHLFALDPPTGKVLHETNYASESPKFEQGKDHADDDRFVGKFDQNRTDYKTFLQPDLSDSFSMAGGAKSDVLVSDGENVYMHQAKFDSNLKRQLELSRHLFSTSNLLDENENHRSHWMLGTGDFSRVPVAYSWIVNSRGARRKNSAMAVPFGVTMAFDDNGVWGVHRGGKTDGQYVMFQRENQPFSQSEESLPDFRTLKDNEQPYPYVWTQPLAIRPRALVKAGGRLYLGAAPTESPAEDPLAAYENRLGGMLVVADAKTGQQTAQIKLSAPAVWDGMAAAERCLFVTTTDGKLRCFGKR